MGKSLNRRTVLRPRGTETILKQAAVQAEGWPTTPFCWLKLHKERVEDLSFLAESSLGGGRFSSSMLGPDF